MIVWPFYVNGHLVSVDDVAEIDEEDMARKMVGRELNQIYPQRTEHTDEVVLKVSNLSIKGVLQDINFDLKKGEVLGFAGLMARVEQRLPEAVLGLRKKDSGEIEINGKKAVINSIADAVSYNLAYLSEDRQGKGLIMNFDIPKNITLISLSSYVRGLIQHKKENQVAREYVKRFDIKAASLHSNLANLSGGNQQKVYLSKWMDTHQHPHFG